MRESSSNPRVVVLSVAIPALQVRADNANQAGAIDREVSMESAQQELRLLTVFDMRMVEVEFKLSVDVRDGNVGWLEHRPVSLELLQVLRDMAS